MKKTNKLLSLLLTLAILLTLAPAAEAPARAEDAGKAIRLVTNGAAENLTGAQTSSVYFGNYMQSRADAKDPIKWRVLQNDAANRKLFLLSDQNLNVVRHKPEQDYLTWETSDLRAWLNGDFFGTAFSAGEQALIPETAVINNMEKPNPGVDNSYGGNDTQDRIFLLTYYDVANEDYGFTDNDSRKATNTYYAYLSSYDSSERAYWAEEPGVPTFWWLRSPGALPVNMGIVNGEGEIDYSGGSAYIKFGGDRPVFYLNLSKVFFTSAAVGGKAGQGALAQIGSYSGSEWKLTLKDAARDGFAVTETSVRAGSDGTVTLSYTGATAYSADSAPNEWVSAFLTDGAGELLYYGRLVQPAAASGTLTLTIPEGLAGGSYKLQVFSEQYNGDKMTDYAGAFDEVALTVGPSVVIDAGGHMTKTGDSGAASQAYLTGAMTPVVYTADDGYYFPDPYSSAGTTTGVTVARDGWTQITVSGTPTANTSVTLAAATAKTKPDAPTAVTAADCTTADNNDGKLIGVTAAMEYKKSDAEGWTPGTGDDITGLVPGVYCVRFKATDTTFASDAQDLTIEEYFTVVFTGGSGKQTDPYQIASADDWHMLARILEKGKDTTGMYFEQKKDITVSEMAGNNAAGAAFCGVYDGGGKTLTVALTASDDGARAPFRAIGGATIQNLKVAGSVSGGIHSAGFAAYAVGTNLIENCVVGTAVTTSHTHCGGVIGHGLDSDTTMRGVVFSGSLPEGKTAGTFWGWSAANAVCVLQDCLDLSESAYPLGQGALAEGSGVTNTYYTGANKAAGGEAPWSAAKRAFSVTAGEGVTLGFGNGTAYNVSGVTAYAAGLGYNGTFCAGEGETVALTLSGSDAGYTASGGTLNKTEGGYALTLGGGNAVIDKAPTWKVTVTNGEGGGDYAEGASVTVTADAPEAGKRFKAWTGADDLTFTDGSAATATATFTMPAGAVTVTATYEDIPYGVSGSFDTASGKLTATVSTPAPAKTLLIAAAYDEDDRQAVVRVVAPEADRTEYDTGLSRTDGYTYSLTLVDSETWAPLCKAEHVKVMSITPIMQ